MPAIATEGAFLRTLGAISENGLKWCPALLPTACRQSVRPGQAQLTTIAYVNPAVKRTKGPSAGAALGPEANPAGEERLYIGDNVRVAIGTALDFQRISCQQCLARHTT